MAIAIFPQYVIRTLIVCSVLALIACGGGGGSKPKDKTPDTFAFTARTNAAPSALVTSAPITITGIDAASPITITGGQYSIAGSAYTDAAGTIKSNQTLTVRVTASATTNTEVQAVVTIGGVSGAFRVTTSPDVIPASFTLGTATGVSLSSENVSSTITVSGIDVAVPISITGGQYAINSGAYTSTVGTISSGQSVKVRVTAAATHSTSVESVLTIGGVSATYTVTTIADTTPEAFSFTAATDVEPNAESISNQITVTGIDAATPISITNGEYSINGGAYTSAAGTVTLNQTVRVKITAPNGTDLTQTAVLTIGGVIGSYVVTTFPDDEAPVAEFKFPTPYTMSEANSVKVRGTVTDYNAITRVQVKVNNGEPFDVTPKAEGDYSSWTAVIPLTSNAENTIVVTTEDEKGNADDNAAQVVIRQAPVASAFPDSLNQIPFVRGGLVHDNYDGRNRLLIPTLSKNIYAIDVRTGVRNIYANLSGNGAKEFRDISIDPITQRLFVLDFSLFELNLVDGGFVAKYDTDLLTESISMVIDNVGDHNKLVICEYDEEGGDVGVVSFSLSNNTFAMVSPPVFSVELAYPSSISLDVEHNRYLITVGNSPISNFRKHEVVAVDRATGERSIFVNNPFGDADAFTEDLFLMSGAVDTSMDRYFVTESEVNKLFEINLSTGARRLFSNLMYHGAEENVVSPNDMVIDDVASNAFLFDSNRRAILLVDLETGQKVILSKNLNDF